MSGETESAAGAGSDTPEAIMEATYRALCRHGYADLTMQDIADESDKSKASLHYHYDTKEDLLLAFLDHLYDSFTEKFAETEGDHAVDRLVTFVDEVLCQSDVEGAEEFQTAYLEIKAQAPYVEAYRDQLERVDAFVRDRVREIVADGIDEGVVRSDVDPRDTAAFVATLIDGVNTRRVAIGETDGSTRNTFLAYVRENLVAPDADVVVDVGDDTAGRDAEAEAESTETPAEAEN
ncbi:TetR/AcrR family transcriptional regulator [Halosimplex salinum]|uniref:TetR/AcrR family transcriptional regulator n=1 Tax=Halosimplex salinum TaxID=1710538 RepID=UPI000F46CD81|nr:TetR/AcrR family transcriptional regulator [Halosimplex salinum]